MNGILSVSKILVVLYPEKRTLFDEFFYKNQLYKDLIRKHSPGPIKGSKLVINCFDCCYCVCRFKHHCMAYHGPTVTLLRLGKKGLLIVAIDVEWR